MSAEEKPGYVYRIATISATALQKLVAQHIKNGWTFGGAAQWDFDSDKRKDNLRAIEAISDQLVNTHGDFGHAFNEDIEIRWKRRDDDVYDVLILSEIEQHIAGAVPLDIGGNQQWRTRHYDKAARQQTGGEPAITYVDYHAPNGAVQFQRFVEVEK